MRRSIARYLCLAHHPLLHTTSVSNSSRIASITASLMVSSIHRVIYSWSKKPLFAAIRVQHFSASSRGFDLSLTVASFLAHCVLWNQQHLSSLTLDAVSEQSHLIPIRRLAYHGNWYLAVSCPRIDVQVIPIHRRLLSCSNKRTMLQAGQK